VPLGVDCERLAKEVKLLSVQLADPGVQVKAGPLVHRAHEVLRYDQDLFDVLEENKIVLLFHEKAPEWPG